MLDRRQYATVGRWHPRVALASGGRVGVHDLRPLPDYRDRSDRPTLCCRRQGGRYLVFSSRVSAFPAGPCARWLRIRHLLRQWRAERVQHPLGDRLVRPYAPFCPCRKLWRFGRDVCKDTTERPLDLSRQSAGRSACCSERNDWNRGDSAPTVHLLARNVAQLERDEERHTAACR